MHKLHITDNTTFFSINSFGFLRQLRPPTISHSGNLTPTSVNIRDTQINAVLTRIKCTQAKKRSINDRRATTSHNPTPYRLQ
jgi:hypothetical protein